VGSATRCGSYCSSTSGRTRTAHLEGWNWSASVQDDDIPGHIWFQLGHSLSWRQYVSREPREVALGLLPELTRPWAPGTSRAPLQAAG